MVFATERPVLMRVLDGIYLKQVSIYLLKTEHNPDEASDSATRLLGGAHVVTSFDTLWGKP